jgi:carboxymethylenebutenolidase
MAMATLFMGGCVVALGSPLAAQESVKKRLETSPRHHEWVQIKTRTGRQVRAFLVFPEVNKPVPAVVVIHENRGLTDWVRGVADQLAEAGYVALAPDLLSETGPNKGGTDSFGSEDAARQGIYRLTPEQVLADLDACVEHLRKLDAVNKTVAVAGFCWGGGQTFNYAVHNPDIAAAFVFYGTAPADAEAFRKIKAPVYGFYGENDQRITGQVAKVKEQMAGEKKKYDPVIYDGAGHGFMRSGEEPTGRPADRQARNQAWERWKGLLKELGRPATRPG